MFRLRTIVALLAGLACWMPLPAVGQEGATEREASARVKHLIEMLASKNAAPTIMGDAGKGDDQTITFPASYDSALQAPVYLAIQQLLNEGEVAVDLLLAHDGDDRYSYSVNSYIDRNVTVSGACYSIAHQHLLCFEPDLHVITRSQFGLYPKLEKFDRSLTKWWEKNKVRGLPVLQVEAIDATIAFLKDVDGQTALPWHADAQPLPINDFNRLRDDNLRTLKAIRHYITETRKPYRPKCLYCGSRDIFGLPWTGRKHNK